MHRGGGHRAQEDLSIVRSFSNAAKKIITAPATRRLAGRPLQWRRKRNAYREIRLGTSQGTKIEKVEEKWRSRQQLSKQARRVEQDVVRGGLFPYKICLREKYVSVSDGNKMLWCKQRYAARQRLNSGYFKQRKTGESFCLGRCVTAKSIFMDF